MSLPATAQAQSAPPSYQTAQAATPANEMPAQRHHGTRLRVYPNRSYYWGDEVYPREDLPPNAVRVCNATYVQEYRPSGTVIVPRMSCYWRR